MSAESPPAKNLAQEAAHLAVELGLTSTIADWLVLSGHRDIALTRRFLDPRLSELSAPDSMLDREAAADRIAEAIRRRERIVVFGDYDCDGITATAILTQAVRQLGGEAEPQLASRFEGGYGLSLTAVEKVLALKPGLVVTCDCGSSDHASLERLGQAGIDAVVIDHHLVPERPLPVAAFLNPHRPECEFGYKGLASCGLALSIAAAIRTKLDRALDVRQWLDLVAIGTIADVAPLDGDNRALVRAGLRALAERPRPGLRALMDAVKISRAGPLSSRDVAFRLAPQLNAPGRMGSPMLALQVLMATEEGEAEALVTELLRVTTARREQQDQIMAEAHSEIEAAGALRPAALVLGKPGWNHGIVGIVAGRLADEFACPVAVAGFDDGHGRGSVRGPAGSRLFDALSAASGSLIRFGGHQAAAGFELQLARLDEFREAFVRAVGDQVPAVSAESTLAHVELCAGDSPEQVLADLDRLEPCGGTNLRPQVAVTGKVSSAREVGVGHLKLRLDLGRFVLECFGVNLGDRAGVLGGRVRVTGDLRRNTFRGVTQAELFVENLMEVD
jgi:single-stranded-DNA-specific exonuclease